MEIQSQSADAPQRTTFFHQAAKASWATSILVCLILVFGKNIGAGATVELIALVLILIGIGLGIVALCGVRRHGSKGVFVPAIVGIAINGVLIFIFGTNFFTARTRAQQRAAAPITVEPADFKPFRVVVPTSDWKLDDSTVRKLHENAFLSATLVKTNSRLRSLAIKYILKGSADSIIEKLSAEMRQPLSSPNVKKVSDGPTRFLNHKAVKIAYEMTQNGQTEYYDAIIFGAENVGWAVVCVGPPDQRDEVEQIFGLYKPNVPAHP